MLHTRSTHIADCKTTQDATALLERLQVLQNGGTRILLQSHSRTHPVDMLTELK